jgi:predicted AlkP superfamily pyrophosphatase or phosphodiesterase
MLVMLTAAQTLAAERPRLGVVLIVDQLSAEAFEARLPRARAGFKRLLAEGYRFRELRYEAAPTVTSVGHSVLSTGAYGEVHGIVANEWLEADTGQPRLCTEDARYEVVGRAPSKRDGTAPSWLRAPTLSESVKFANPLAKSVVISGKDRSAILSAGHAADAVVWFDAEKPIFVTSTYYAKALPDFVAPVNASLLEQLAKGLIVWGLPGGGITGKNPERVGRMGDSEPFAERRELQPVIDAAEVDLALGAVKQLELGKDEVVDLLTISFSGHDRVGHVYGPDAPEALAEFDAVDAQIGRLLEGLDAQVGKGRYVVALSSDHGVAPLPADAKKRGLDAGQVDTEGLMAALEKEADAALGPGDWFVGYRTPGFTVNAKLRAKLHTADERLRAVAQRFPGVVDLLPQSELVHAGAFGSTGELFRKGLVPGRSPDYVILTRAYWTYGLGDPTAHGSAYLYDRAVPALFSGPGVTPGTGSEAEAIDFAPTVARLLGVPAPAATRGHALTVVTH